MEAADPDAASSLPQENSFRTYKLLLSGGLAGAISRTLTAPIDRLKFVLQVQEGAHMMTLREGIQKVSAEGSLKAYFRGNGTNVIKIASETALKLTLNDFLKHLIASQPDSITPFERVLAGGVSGGTAQLLLYPLDTIRTRLATAPTGLYHGIYHAAETIHRTEGLRAMYRGLTPSMIGILPFAGIDIALFELLKERLLDEYGGRPPSYAVLGAGMISSSVAQVVSYPLALVRTRLQAQRGSGQELRYRGMLDVVSKTVAREGPKGLFKGMLPNLIKLAPSAGVSWYIFEQSKLLLGLDPRS